MKKVSVIIPMYQAEDFVEPCIRSVLNQTYRELEIVVINDGSTDRGPEICRKLCRQSGRIRLLCQKNRGVSSARNRGLDAATGEYVFFLDSDDVIHPQLIEALVKRTEACHAQFALCRMPKRKEQRKHTLQRDRLRQLRKIDWEMVEGQELENWFWLNNRYSLTGIGGKLVNREWIGELRFEEKLTNGEDTVFLYWLICRQARMVYLDVGWYYYRMHAESLTHSPFVAGRPDYFRAVRMIRDREYRNNRLVFARHWERLLLWRMEETARAMWQQKTRKDWRRLKKRGMAERRHPLFRQMGAGTRLLFSLCFCCYPLYVVLDALRPAVWKIRKMI